MLNNEDLILLDNHWAVNSISSEKKEAINEIADKIMVTKSVGNQMHIELNLSEGNIKDMVALANAYELAAIEGIDAYISGANDELRRQCIAGAWKAFEFYRLLGIPHETDEKIYFILHLSAIAYCGERWSDLSRWYEEHNEQIMPKDTDAEMTWDKRILYCLYNCWCKLFNKKNWDDLTSIQNHIIKLRTEQNIYEKEVLPDNDIGNRSMAFRLVSLYNWAKCTELLSLYSTQGEPPNIKTQLDKHFEVAIESATMCYDARLEILLRWLYCAARQMVESSIWWVARSLNSVTTRFVENATKYSGLFEMLPPQKAALREQGLLDPANIAVVVELPTSGGKTLLAQFKILQALNQFKADGGWVAYVAPTKALASQITRKLRKDFSPIGINVERLSAAIEIDAFEEDMLKNKDNAFDVLVSTPEKLQLVIRNKKIPRSLALVIMDEAHNIEDQERGLRIELLLATIRSDCNNANFLLLMPYVENAETLARWLASDANGGKSISIGSTPWQPNERLVGIYKKERLENSSDWQIKYKTLTSSPKTIYLKGEYTVGGIRPLRCPQSQVNSVVLTASMAKVFSNKGTSLAIGRTIKNVWSMARKLYNEMPVLEEIPPEIDLVQKYLKIEIGPDFELIDLLSKGIGVHNAGLSDEIKILMEWLAEEGKLKVLCATTTIAQGINFPVSSVFLQSTSYAQNKYPFSVPMKPRDFWNLAGRAGRVGQSSVGVVGIAANEDNEEAITSFVGENTGALISRLVTLLDEIDEAGQLNNLSAIIYSDEWIDFRCYVAHLYREKQSLDAVLANTEQLLRNTFGYNTLRSSADGTNKARALLEATKKYANDLSENSTSIILSDMTGFSPEGVRKVLAEVQNLENKLTIDDLKSESIFGEGDGLSELYGIMLKLPQLQSLSEIAGKGMDNRRIAEITNSWVSGNTIKEIAETFFQTSDDVNVTDSITNTCRAIYKIIANNGTWGLSALTKLSGIDFNNISPEQLKEINALPAMIYHGVNTYEAVLMRMNDVPRSIATNLGMAYISSGKANESTVQEARSFIKELKDEDWDKLKNPDSPMNGAEYREIWKVLSGE
jgi:replicative superfamily II helicase